ncbi:flagellar export chaperone FliS [Variovorax sp. DXTD-1]|uniref:flagellar export chaperone FliS n=1 Tax=Variovorax sp. DXTD-1 TaxID=2495592 RepID=UPI000F8600AD|nr:flagellar export chaperone FliS [Variovorax sp. DXTD-1]RST49022.1 flagellar export chaperone FliS [Variovorax sp. DXTD-1]
MRTPHTSRAGANAYARVGVETQAMSASPQQLIAMLFDGVVTTIGMARHHMASGDTVAKGNAISKAISIVDNGLKASLDAKAAGAAGAELVANLSALYDFVIRRLLYANLHHDVKALDEAEAILENIASAWREVGGASADN